MSLTPEQIAEKDFLIGLRGFDREEVRFFLRTVADAFRQAEAKAAASAPTPPAPVAEPVAAAEAAPAPQAASPSTSGTDWANLGDEIAAVLRTAHEQATGLRTDAQNEVRALRQQAETEAAATRSSAAADAEAARAEAEQARTEAAATLAKAQDEALTLVSDAQARVDRMMEASKLRAKEEADAHVAHLTGQIDELSSAREASRSQLTDLRARIEKALSNADVAPPGAADTIAD